MNRRQLLKTLGAAGAVAVFRDVDWLATMQAQVPIDWAARVSALARPADDELVITAVGDMIISSPAAGRQDANVQEMYRILRESDVAFGNCEQPVASVGFMYQKTSQMAWPEILDDFKASGFTMLASANNHYMDLGPEALLQGLNESRTRGFAIAGAGRDLDEAIAPGVATVKGRRVGLVSFWCNQLQPGGYFDYARAGADKPGVAVIGGATVTVPGSNGTTTLLLPVAADMATLDRAIRAAKSQVDVLLVSFHFHWGGAGLGQGARQSDPNNRRILPADLGDPRNQVAEGRRLIARAAIDAGADVIIGHGPHVLNGVEIYRGKPILYSLGHFYMEILKNGRALPEFRFNPGMVRSVENNWYLEEHRWAAIARMFVRGDAITRLEVLPVYMDVQEDGFPFLPADVDSQRINAAMAELSGAFATRMRAQGWYSNVALGA